jgi:hypothetical protein
MEINPNLAISPLQSHKTLSVNDRLLSPSGRCHVSTENGVGMSEIVSIRSKSMIRAFRKNLAKCGGFLSHERKVLYGKLNSNVVVLCY